MAPRKWTAETIGDWIAEAARQRLEAEAQRQPSEALASLGRLEELDSIALQGLGARLGRYVWERRLTSAGLEDLRVVIVRRQASDETLALSQRAFLLAIDALLEAIALGDAPVTEPYDAGKLTRLADRIVRGRSEERTVVNAGLARSLVEPLLAGDRSAFRTLLGDLAEVLVTLDSAGINGRIDSPLDLPLYWELKALQWLSNGVLQASRSPAVTQTRARPTLLAQP